MTQQIRNIYGDIPATLSEELFQTVAECDNVRIERIVSDCQATPAGEWYDQGWDEWVILLAGSAGLSFENQSGQQRLQPGDYLLIPANCRHRVEWTDPEQKTVWLAVHITNQTDKENIT